jgi:hypothetical protein
MAAVSTNLKLTTAPRWSLASVESMAWRLASWQTMESSSQNPLSRSPPPPLQLPLMIPRPLISLSSAPNATFLCSSSRTSTASWSGSDMRMKASPEMERRWFLPWLAPRYSPTPRPLHSSTSSSGSESNSCDRWIFWRGELRNVWPSLLSELHVHLAQLPHRSHGRGPSSQCPRHDPTRESGETGEGLDC